MYRNNNIRNQYTGSNIGERHPIMTPVGHPASSQNRRNYESDVNTNPQGNAFPLSSLRNEDGGYLGPASVDHINPSSSADQWDRNARPSNLHSNPLPQYANARPKDIPQSNSGSADFESSSFQSERHNRGKNCQITGCEQMLLLLGAILLIIILALATGLVILQQQGQSSLDTATTTCQSRECVRAAGDILESLDETAEPCENFVQFACGGWNAKHPVPESTYRWSRLDVLEENLLYEVKSILESKPAENESNPAKAARIVYHACVNDTKWSEVGLSPMISLLDEIGGIPMSNPNWEPSSFHLEEILAWLRKAGGQNIVSLSVFPDMLNNSYNSIYLGPGLLPVSNSVLTNDSAWEKNSHLKYMKKSAQLLLKAKGFEENETLSQAIEDDANAVFKFYIELHKIIQEGNPEGNPWKTYNPMTIKELNNFTRHPDLPFNIDWLSYIEKAFNQTNITIGEDQVIILQHPLYFKNLNSLLNQTGIRTIANFLLYQLVHAMAEETSSSLRNLRESLETPLKYFGRTSMRPWHDCTKKTRILLHIGLAELYFKKHRLGNFSHMANQLVSDVAGAFRSMLESAMWMSNSTSNEALRKLEQMVHLLPYPQDLFYPEEVNQHMEGLPVVSPDDHFGNLMALTRWHSYRSLAKLTSTPSRSRWPSGPVEINAFYSSLQNAIVIPGAVLQPPLFYHEDLAALNYGGIGAIIGHEITHGFDTNGRQFDWSGKLYNWWDNHTMSLYKNRSKCFEDQYSEYNVSDLLHPYDTVKQELKIDGSKSKGENVADNGGVRAAWLAYKNHIKETGEDLVLPGLQKYNQDQLFFISFSRLWCMQFTPWALAYSLENDIHPPGQFRTLGSLQNTKEFAETFQCPVGSRMNPKKKCILW